MILLAYKTHRHTHSAVDNTGHNIAQWLRTRTPETDCLNSDPIFSTKLAMTLDKLLNLFVIQLPVRQWR